MSSSRDDQPYHKISKISHDCDPDTGLWDSKTLNFFFSRRLGRIGERNVDRQSDQVLFDVKRIIGRRAYEPEVFQLLSNILSFFYPLFLGSSTSYRTLFKKYYPDFVRGHAARVLLF